MVFIYIYSMHVPILMNIVSTCACTQNLPSTSRCSPTNHVEVISLSCAVVQHIPVFHVLPIHV